jgi:hypothetical protein
MNDSESGDAMLRIAEDYERHVREPKTESWHSENHESGGAL